MKPATNQQQFPAISQKLKATHIALPPTHTNCQPQLSTAKLSKWSVSFSSPAMPKTAYTTRHLAPKIPHTTTSEYKPNSNNQCDTYLPIRPHNTSQTQNHTLHQQTHHVYLKWHLRSPHKRLVYLRTTHLHPIANIQHKTTMSTTKQFASCS